MDSTYSLASPSCRLSLQDGYRWRGHTWVSNVRHAFEHAVLVLPVRLTGDASRLELDRFTGCGSIRAKGLLAAASLLSLLPASRTYAFAFILFSLHPTSCCASYTWMPLVRDNEPCVGCGALLLCSRTYLLPTCFFFYHSCFSMLDLPSPGFRFRLSLCRTWLRLTFA